MPRWTDRLAWPRLVPGVKRLHRQLDETRKALQEARQALADAERKRADEQQSAWNNAKRYAVAYRRLVAASLGQAPKELGVARTTAPGSGQSQSAAEHIRGLRERSLLFDVLASGAPMTEAVATTVRARLRAGDQVSARSLSHALLADPATATAGALGAALVAADRQLPELAWSHFQQVPPEVWRPLAPVEFLRTAFTVDSAAALTTARDLRHHPPADLAPAGWMTLVRALLDAGEVDLAGDTFDLADRLAQQDPQAWASTDADRDWLRPWIDRLRRPPAAPQVPAGHVTLAVLGHHDVDRRTTSSDIGEHIQTVAVLGHVLRHENLRVHGPPEWVDLVTRLRERVPPQSRLDTTGDVTLVPLDRHVLSHRDVPPQTWLIASCLPRGSNGDSAVLHPHLQPLFVSFHCSRPASLTPQVIDYLRAHEPIGCRDWSTVDLLLSAGVKAFFSGCLTTTLGTLFPPLAAEERPGEDTPVAYVDVPARDAGQALTHERDDVRHASQVANLRTAVDLLDDYRRRYRRIETSRLHCYLAGRAVGATVEFRPQNPADPALNGLLDLTDAQFTRMRDRLLAALEPVLSAIFAGNKRADVYAIWREVWASEVRLAEERHRSVPTKRPPSFDVAAACQAIRSRQVRVERPFQCREVTRSTSRSPWTATSRRRWRSWWKRW